MVEWPKRLITGALPKKTEIPTTKEKLKRKILNNLSQVAESQDIINLSTQCALQRVFRIVAHVKRLIPIC